MLGLATRSLRLTRPIVPLSNDWPSIEAKLGKLPQDYKGFIDAFGGGCVDGFLWILDPATENPNLNILEQTAEQRGQLAGSTRRLPGIRREEIPCLVVWGITDNGDICAWLNKEDDPSAWQILVLDPSAEWSIRRRQGMLAFLDDLLAHRITQDVLPEEFPSEFPAPYESLRPASGPFR